MDSTVPPPPLLQAAPNSRHNRTPSQLSDTDTIDTASQKSISLSSPAGSKRNSWKSEDPRQSFSTTSSGDYAYSKSGSDPFAGMEDVDVSQSESNKTVPGLTVSSEQDSPQGSDSGGSKSIPLPTYPPTRMSRHQDDTASIAESFTSTSSRKTRPESLLMAIPTGSLILGVALVDFNHLVCT
jgi:hypothetical protein